MSNFLKCVSVKKRMVGSAYPARLRVPRTHARAWVRAARSPRGRELQLILTMVKKAKKAKRVRSETELEANRERQRARDERARLKKLLSKKQEEKEKLRGVGCSPASPLTEKEMEKKACGRRKKQKKLNLSGSGVPRL